LGISDRKTNTIYVEKESKKNSERMMRANIMHGSSRFIL
jgi:hypothetical protein